MQSQVGLPLVFHYNGNGREPGSGSIAPVHTRPGARSSSASSAYASTAGYPGGYSNSASYVAAPTRAAIDYR